VNGRMRRSRGKLGTGDDVKRIVLADRCFFRLLSESGFL